MHKVVLRGIGQVMLQNSALTGLIFLAGIFYNSWQLGVAALGGCIVSTLSAYALKYSTEDIENGLYGFNGTLVGIAMWFYFGVTVASTLLGVVGAAISTVVMYAMKKKIPTFTAPFVITTWALFIFARFVPVVNFALGELSDKVHFSAAITQGLGQVMFQGNVITGILIFVAILVNSRVAALYALYGSILGALTAMIFHFSPVAMGAGLYGYNAVLCGIALGAKQVKAFVVTSIAIVLSVLITYGFQKSGAVALTAPFVLSTWVGLLIQKRK